MIGKTAVQIVGETILEYTNETNQLPKVVAVSDYLYIRLCDELKHRILPNIVNVITVDGVRVERASASMAIAGISASKTKLL